MEELRNVRVYSYTRIRYLVLYGIVLVGLLAWGVEGMYRLPFISSSTQGWLTFDIPWMCLVLAVWLAAIVQMSYGRKPLTLQVDRLKSVCIITEGDFSGTWRLRKYSVRSASSTMILTALCLILILAMAILDGSNLYRATSTVNKVTAMEGLCQAAILLGLIIPLLSTRRYSSLILLRSKDRWLSLQFRNGSQVT